MGKIIRNGVEYSGSGGGGGGSWITDIPEMHRNLFRGEDLGDSVTSAQLAAIADGSFTDLYVGDYWTIATTINGSEVDVNYRIADMDYFLNREKDNDHDPYSIHHLVIMPDTSLITAAFWSTGSQRVRYYQSYMYTTIIPQVDTILENVFSTHLLTHPERFDNNDSGITKRDVKAVLPGASQLTGWAALSIFAGSDYFPCTYEPIFSLFSLCPKFSFILSAETWTRDQAETNSYGVATMSNVGRLSVNAGIAELGVRPYFLLG